MSDIDILEMQKAIQNHVNERKNWNENLVQGTAQLLEYTSRIGQVFLEVNNKVLTDVLEDQEQSEMVREFLTDPNKIYLILVKTEIDYELDQMDETEQIGSSLTNKSETKQVSSIGEFKNEEEQEQTFFTENIEQLKEVFGDAILIFKTNELDRKKFIEQNYLESCINVYSLGEVGSSFNIFQTLNGCIKSAFMPLFTGVISALNVNEEKRAPVLKKFLSENSLVTTVQKNLAEITLEINQRIQTTEITFEKFAHDERILEMCKGYSRIEEINIPESLYKDINFMNSLHELIKKWEGLMRAKIKEVGEPHQTDSLTDEVNLWNRYFMSLGELQKQFNSIEVKLTIRLLKGTNIQKLREAEKDLRQKHEDVEHFLSKVKFVKINDVLSSTSPKELVDSINSNIPQIKKIYNKTDFSAERLLKVVELFQRDLIKKLVEIFKERKVLQSNAEDFKTIVIKTFLTQVKIKFESTSGQLVSFVKSSLKSHTKTKRKSDNLGIVENFVKRCEAIAEFIEKHEQYVAKYTKLHRAEEDDWRDWLQAVNFPKVNQLVQAYTVLDNADVFDISPMGTRAFEDIKQSYNRMIESIFKDTIQSIREMWGLTKTPRDRFRMLSRVNVFLDITSIKLAIKSYQEKMTLEVQERIDEYVEMARSTLGENKRKRLLTKRYRTTSQVILLVRLVQIKGNLEKYMENLQEIWGGKLSAFCRDIKTTYNNIMQQLNKNIEELVKKAVEKYNLNVGEKRSSMIVLKKQSGTSDLELHLNSDHETGVSIKNLKHILVMQNSISEKKIITINYTICYWFKKIYWKYYLSVPGLKDSIKTFNLLAMDLKPSETELLADYLSIMYEKIQFCMDVSINTSFNYDIFDIATEFGSHVGKLSIAYESLRNHMANIDDTIQALKESDVNHSSMKTIITKIQNIVNQMNTMECKNMEKFVKNLNEKIENVLYNKLLRLLQKWTKEFKTFNENYKNRDFNNQCILEVTQHTLKIENQEIFLDPPVENSRVFWLSHLQSFITSILTLPKLKQITKKNTPFIKDKIGNKEFTFANLIDQIPFELLNEAYERIDNALSGVETFVTQWKTYESLWAINVKAVYQMLGDDNLKWQQLLEEIEKGQGKLFNYLVNERLYGPVVLFYKSLQARVNSKYEQLQKDILKEFATTISKQKGSFFKNICEARTKLQNMDISDSDNIITSIQLLKEIKSQLLGWDDEISRIKAAEKILKKQKFNFPEKWVPFSQIESEWDRLRQTFERREQEYNADRTMIEKILLKEEESVLAKIKEIETLWEKKKPYDGELHPSEALDVINELETKISENKASFSRLNHAKELLGLPSLNLATIKNIEEDSGMHKELWAELSKLWAPVDKIMTGFLAVATPNKYNSVFDKVLENLKGLPSKFVSFQALRHKKDELKGLKKKNKLFKEMRTEAVKAHHWTKILKILSMRKQYKNMQVGDVFNCKGLLKEEKKIMEIISEAQGEFVLESMLKKIKDYWVLQEFELSQYQNRCMLIRGWEPLMTQVEDDIGQLTSMKLSQYFKIFEDEIKTWNNDLLSVQGVLDTWVNVQKKWVYLEGIFFSSQDIKQQLTQEYNRFRNVDSEFIALMKKVQQRLRVLEICQNIDNLQKNLERIYEALEKIQKALTDYLETQRQAFSRFYFVGDEDLLEIIGNSKNVINVQKHFLKMFAGINTVTTEEEGDKIMSMRSRELEEIKFTTPVKISENPKINEWLSQIEKQMQISLGDEFTKAVKAWSLQKDPEVSELVKTYAAQIMLISFITLWTFLIEEQLMKSTDRQLDKLIEFLLSILDFLAKQVLGNLPPIQRAKYQHLITDLVHKRDTTRKIANDKNLNVHDFGWIYNMRYYCRTEGLVIPDGPDLLSEKMETILKGEPKKGKKKKAKEEKTEKKPDQLIICVGNSRFNYGYEYLGITEKLVQTPLTDKCYFTLTQALWLKMGGSPFGPAGTGKTESVKMLGACLGRFVLVFCCDENFNFKAMGRIFIGLCQVGAWGCFDEFNRLEERILSAVSQQIQVIQIGLRDSGGNIRLMERDIQLNPKLGIFITMNPGYSGRSPLPENLKQLFRQLAMIKPDRELIAQVILFSQGFKQAEELSGKIVSLFELCGDQLSSQPHYDFGLRALKSVLSSAGKNKRKLLQEGGGEESNSVEKETLIILTSFCDTVFPKLISEDTPLLYTLIKGVFPTCDVPKIDDPALRPLVTKELKKRMLLENDQFIEKILQLNQIMKIQHGIMLVGPTGCGKSACWQTLFNCLNQYEETKGDYYIIDPKALTKDELYGVLDDTTMEWTDGVFTYLVRKIIENPNKRQWVIFDGDVDPEWVENLNSVLDDNKLFTLPNGERLSIPPNMKIIFEAPTLKHATLATVSRCGMVWFSKEVLANEDIYFNYLNRLAQDEFDNKFKNENSLNPKYFDIRQKAVHSIESFFYNAQISEIVTGTKMNYSKVVSKNSVVSTGLKMAEKRKHVMIFTRMRVLEALFALIRKGVDRLVEQAEQGTKIEDNVAKKFIRKWTLMAIQWSFVGDLSLDERAKFFEELQQRVGTTMKELIDLPQTDSKTTLIDYSVDIKTGNWVKYQNLVHNEEVSGNQVSNADVIIQTVDTLRHQEILCSWLLEGRPFIICGPPGSGKTMTLMSTLKSLNNYDMIFVNFSATTDPAMIIKQFDHYCEIVKSQGLVLRPKQLNKNLVIFCDEINLPDEDRYETQFVITFLRQITEQGGFWRVSDKQWIRLERIQFVGACNPPVDAGRHEMAPRFLRHCPVMLVDFPSYQSLITIYGTFNRGMLRSYPSLKDEADNLTNAMVDFYYESQKHFTADMQPHYIYSPRELTRWKYAIIEGLSGVENMAHLVRLWAHEGLRLFEDRLVYDEEKIWCQQKLDEIYKRHFSHINPGCMQRPILFSKYLSKNYSSVDIEDLRQYVLSKLKTFSEEEYQIQLVVFDSVLDHIIRIDRVLRQPLGHCLLVGASGVGKTTLSRFVSWMNGLQVFQIKAGRNFTLADFDMNLRDVMKRSGCKGEKICFIFDESNVLSVSFMEKMNALLASGEIPGLFEGDEYNALIACFKEHQGASSKAKDEEEIYSQFIKNVQRNLHVVFTMNPSNEDFANRATSSPAIFNRCVIDWFGDWSLEALTQVASELSEHLVIPEGSLQNQDQEAHPVIVNLLVKIHESVKSLNDQLRKNAKKFNYITPRDFLDFLKQFSAIFEEKYQMLTEQQSHLRNGLDKLKDTEDKVAAMDANLKKYQVELKERDEEANNKLQMILTETKVAEKSEKELTELQVVLKAKQKEIKEKKVEVQGELDEAGPALIAAKNAVEGLTSKDIDDIKNLNKPNPNIRLVMVSVCMVMTGKTMEWKEIRNLLKKRGFIDSLLNLDVDKEVSEKIKKKCGIFLDEKIKSGEWNMKAFNYSYKAAGALALWFESATKFGNLLTKVEPLKQEINGYEKEEKKLIKQQKDLKKNLANIKQKIEGFKLEYKELISRVEKIRNESKEVEKKVNTSRGLLANLSSENTRWTQSVAGFAEQIANMTGDVLLSAGFVTYCGYFDQAYRSLLFNTWKRYLNEEGLRFKRDLSLVEYLCTIAERMNWKSHQLPDDELCTENAIILQRFSRYPLIIDPTGQAFTYVLSLKKDKKIKTTSFDSANFMKVMENGLRFGLPVLIENVEKIDPLMNSILNKEVTKQGGRNLVRIGDQEIDFDNRFQLFMLTRDAETRFTPDICSRVTFVNFTITTSSLENQCVNLYLKNERPEVEKKRLNLLKLQGEFVLKLRKLEDDLLIQLNSSDGDLLNNTTLINKLDNLKKEATEVQEQMDNSDTVLAEVERETNLYRPLAKFSSRIYFVLKSFIDIDNFYQFSFNYYMNIIHKLLKNNKYLDEIPKDQFAERVQVLETRLFISVFHHVEPALREDHKLLVALRFCQVKLGPEYSSVFNTLFETPQLSVTQKSKWEDYSFEGKLDKILVERLIGLCNSLNDDNGLCRSILSNSYQWEEFMKGEEYSTPSLDWYKDKEDEIKTSIVESSLTCILRPNSGYWKLEKMISGIMSEEFMNIKNLDIKELITTQVDQRTPLFMSSAPGFDPSDLVYKIAVELGKKLEMIALGSAEGFDLAKKAIERFQKSGGWVMLKNVHLATSWLKYLEENLLSKESSHRDFKIILVSEFSPKIPATLLLKSIKLVFENPKGIKANIKRFFPQMYKKNMFEKDPVERQRLYFHLVWLHAVIMERLRYIPIGWSKTYEFSVSDLACNIEIINAYLSKDMHGPQDSEDYFIALRSIICENIYGGKIDNVYDLKILKSLVDQYISREAFEEGKPLVEEAGKVIVENFSAKTFEEYLDWIQKLNIEESPLWAGLPVSAEEVLNKQKIARLVSLLNQIQDVNDEQITEIKSGENENEQSNQFQWLKTLYKTVLNFEKLVERETLTKMKVTKESIKDPMFRFINRENNLALNLRAIINEHIIGLKQMSDGSDTRVGQDIKKIGKIVFSGQIPKDWIKYTILKELNVSIFVEDFMKRLKQLNQCVSKSNWQRNGVNLGNMFFPEAFFTATRQLVAMNTGLSLDELELKVRLAPGESQVDENSFLISGMTIEGVEWNSRDGIVVSDTMSTKLEDLCFSWKKCLPGEQKTLKERQMFIPLYLNNSRDNLILSLKFDIPENCKIGPKKLFQRGIALIAWTP